MDPEYGSDTEKPETTMPESLSGPTVAVAWIGIFTWLLDIIGLVLSIVSIAPGKSIPHITYSTKGYVVGGAQVALSFLGFFADLFLNRAHPGVIQYLHRNFNHETARETRKTFLIWFFPIQLIFFGGWLATVVVQASYVPMLGRTELRECSWDHTKSKMCKGSNGVWVVGILLCVFHLVSMAVKAEIFRRLGHPENEAETSLLMGVRGTDPSRLGKKSDMSSREPSMEVIVGEPSKIV
ncbi:hypothetical protein ACJZ2D_015246 [Fusarium nematophilum]